MVIKNFMKAAAKPYLHLMNDNNWAAEVKYDGERYMLYILNEGNKMYSRHTNKDGERIEKGNRLPHLINQTYKGMNGTILDGEVIGKTLEDTVSVTGSLPDRAIALQKERGWLRYMVFDILFYKGKDVRSKSFFERKKILKIAVKEANNKYIISVKSTISKKKELFKKVKEKHMEGIVLKNIYNPYVPGLKHKDWIKVKNTINVDVVIMDYEMGKGKYNKDKIGAIIYGAYKGKKLVRWGKVAGMTKAVINQLTNDSQRYRWSVIEIEGQGYTGSGNVRHPRFKRFRKDKKPIECKKEIQT